MVWRWSFFSEKIPLVEWFYGCDWLQSFFCVLAGGQELERALFYLDVEGIGVDAEEFR